MKKNENLGRVYKNGELIFKEGESGEVMYVIQDGNVSISKQAPGGEIMVATLKKGDILGEMALFDKQARSATARSMGDSTVLSIDKKKLFQNISHDPTILFRIIETMSLRIRTLTTSISQLKESRKALMQYDVGVEETCRQILNEARLLVHADKGSVMLLDAEGAHLEIQAGFGGESDRKVKLAVGEGIAGSVVENCKAELVNNVSLDSRYKSGSSSIQSLICVPLKYEGIRGVINMSNGSERLFTLENLKDLNALSLYASISIFNADAYSKLSHSTDEVLTQASLSGIV